MTIIAAIATPDRVVMGCDTRADYGGTAIHKADGKIGIFDLAGERVLIGISGHGGILAVLQRRLKLPDFLDSSSNAGADEWANHLAEAATTVLAETNPPLLTVADADGSASFDGIGLLAWRQHVWVLQTHYALRPASGIAAIGCGTDLALGSLHTSKLSGTDPEQAVQIAVQLACVHISGCGIDERGPLTYATEDIGA